jgi:hypothetical protein
MRAATDMPCGSTMQRAVWSRQAFRVGEPGQYRPTRLANFACILR